LAATGSVTAAKITGMLLPASSCFAPCDTGVVIVSMSLGDEP
jgi:hypothetical protein